MKGLSPFKDILKKGANLVAAKAFVLIETVVGRNKEVVTV
ncbi:unnamed protein product, partial [marine sediment metagenome]